MIRIKVAEDFTEIPGARYESQGEFSGEKFRETILYPKFIEALEKKENLVIDLDGGYGYGSSFLEEAFGGLVRKLKEEKNEHYVDVKNIEIISDDNIAWIEKIRAYIREEIENEKGVK